MLGPVVSTKALWSGRGSASYVLQVQQHDPPTSAWAVLLPADPAVRKGKDERRGLWDSITRLQPDSQGSTAKKLPGCSCNIQFTCFVIESSCSHILSVGNSIQSQICRMCLRQAIMTCQGDGRKIVVLSRPKWKCESAFQNRSLYALSMPLTHTTYSTSHIDQIFYNQIISPSTSVPKQKWTSM